jgi:hypothetical protein
MAAVLVKEFPRKLEKRDKDNYSAKIGGTIFSNVPVSPKTSPSDKNCKK